jgi:hypothetical protein
MPVVVELVEKIQAVLVVMQVQAAVVEVQVLVLQQQEQ